MMGTAGHDELRGEVASLRAEVKRLRQQLDRLTAPLTVLLHRRGFQVYKKQPDDDLLLPDAPLRDSFYELLHKYSFRLFLRDVIKHQERFSADLLTRYATARTVRTYLDRLLGAGLIETSAGGYRLLHRPVLSFGPTLEWYVAELLKREFGAEVLRGVKFRRPKVGGDYDVIGKLDGALLYVEVKSSPPKQIYDSEVAAFLDRVDDLSPEMALFLMDTELRMKDKIVPMFEKELAKRYTEPPPVLRLERELFHVQDRIFIVNAKESISRNIGRVVGRHFRKRGGHPPALGPSKSIGTRPTAPLR